MKEIHAIPPSAAAAEIDPSRRIPGEAEFFPSSALTAEQLSELEEQGTIQLEDGRVIVPWRQSINGVEWLRRIQGSQQ